VDVSVISTDKRFECSSSEHFLYRDHLKIRHVITVIQTDFDKAFLGCGHLNVADSLSLANVLPLTQLLPDSVTALPARRYSCPFACYEGVGWERSNSFTHS